MDILFASRLVRSGGSGLWDRGGFLSGCCMWRDSAGSDGFLGGVGYTPGYGGFQCVSEVGFV